MPIWFPTIFLLYNLFSKSPNEKYELTFNIYFLKHF
jgi:hypothetical protein